MKQHFPLILIVIGAVLLRVIVLPFVTFPGVADPNHYYNLGVRLVNGEGCTINYIWQYNDLYADGRGDGRLIVMTQDPFILGYVGMTSLMFPQGNRDDIYAVAQRCGVDYLLMPSDRAALDALLLGAETDPRFTRIVEVPGTPFVFYRMEGL